MSFLKKKKKKKGGLDLDLRSYSHPMHAWTSGPSPYVVPMLCCKHERFLIHGCQDIDTQNINLGNYCILGKTSGFDNGGQISKVMC